MVIISAGSGDRFACEGSLYQACTLCAFPATNILVQGVQLPGLAVFNLSNTSTQAVDLTGLRISVRGFDQSPDMTYVSLDGQMPGMPWTASPGSTIPAGGQIEISVTAEFLDYSPGLPYELLLEFDADGDGDMEPIASVELSNVIAPTASVLAFSRGSDGSIALEWTRSGWTLQQAGNLSGVWSDLPGATSPYTIAPVQGAAMFYRLILRP
jgi:hypothetical protein